MVVHHKEVIPYACALRLVHYSSISLWGSLRLTLFPQSRTCAKPTFQYTRVQNNLSKMFKHEKHPHLIMPGSEANLFLLDLFGPIEFSIWIYLKPSQMSLRKVRSSSNSLAHFCSLDTFMKLSTVILVYRKTSAEICSCRVTGSSCISRN